MLLKIICAGFYAAAFFGRSPQKFCIRSIMRVNISVPSDIASKVRSNLGTDPGADLSTKN